MVLIEDAQKLIGLDNIDKAVLGARSSVRHRRGDVQQKRNVTKIGTLNQSEETVLSIFVENVNRTLLDEINVGFSFSVLNHALIKPIVIEFQTSHDISDKPLVCKVLEFSVFKEHTESFSEFWYKLLDELLLYDIW